MTIRFFFYAFLLTIAALLLGNAYGAQTLHDPRYCGTPVRNADGDIVRSAAVIRAFKKIHPCPSTGLPTGACQGWAVDHVISLGCGGCDNIGNLQWLPNSIKSSSNLLAKDRWERKIYAAPFPIEGTEACSFEVVK